MQYDRLGRAPPLPHLFPRCPLGAAADCRSHIDIYFSRLCDSATGVKLNGILIDLKGLTPSSPGSCYARLLIDFAYTLENCHRSLAGVANQRPIKYKVFM